MTDVPWAKRIPPGCPRCHHVAHLQQCTVLLGHDSNDRDDYCECPGPVSEVRCNHRDIGACPECQAVALQKLTALGGSEGRTA